MIVGPEHVGEFVKGRKGTTPIFVLNIGAVDFWGLLNGDGYSFPRNLDWELVKNKEKVAPALVIHSSGKLFQTGTFYSSEKEAREAWVRFGEYGVIWPAPVPDKDGFYEVPK